MTQDHELARTRPASHQEHAHHQHHEPAPGAMELATCLVKTDNIVNADWAEAKGRPAVRDYLAAVCA
jgi:hypothetical protein